MASSGRWHVKADGALGPCEATVRGCPLGASATHFDDEAAARAYSVELLAQQGTGAFGTSRRRDLVAQEEALSEEEALRRLARVKGQLAEAQGRLNVLNARLKHGLLRREEVQEEVVAAEGQVDRLQGRRKDLQATVTRLRQRRLLSEAGAYSFKKNLPQPWAQASYTVPFPGGLTVEELQGTYGPRFAYGGMVYAYISWEQDPRMDYITVIRGRDGTGREVTVDLNMNHPEPKFTLYPQGGQRLQEGQSYYLMDGATGEYFELSDGVQVHKLSPDDLELVHEGTFVSAWNGSDLKEALWAAPGHYAYDGFSSRVIPLARLVAVPREAGGLPPEGPEALYMGNEKGFSLFDDPLGQD